MPLTADQIKSLIITSVGDDAAGTLADNIDLLWEGHDDTANLSLRGLLTKLDAIDMMLGRVRQQVSFRTSSGSSVDLDQLFQHLRDIRSATAASITQVQSGIGGGIAIGVLTHTAPIMRDRAGQPDPNDRTIRGDPLRGRRYGG